MNGFLCVLKPPGMTSSDVVLFMRKRLPKGTKVGHAGTLDPEAAGVLPLMIGRATRLFDLVTDKKKTYLVQWKPGVITDTQDAFGRVLGHRTVHVTPEDVQAVLPRFTGIVMQKPPMYSAIKRDGQRLYDLARKGESVELEPRPVAIDSIRIVRQGEDGALLLEVACGRGTYMRTLCHDLGEALGCGAHMGMLLRTKAGAFSIEDAYTLEELDGMTDYENALMPMDAPLAHLPAVRFSAAAEKLVHAGNPVPLPLAEVQTGREGPLRLYLGDAFCGIGHLAEDRIRFDAMLL